MSKRGAIHPAEKALRILHLEDDLRDQELVRATLEAEGLACQVEVVSTEEGFAQALENGGFDLVLSDYALPSFNGLTALRMAREKALDVPWIFLSGTLGEEAAIEAVRAGATDYVLKQRLARLVPAVHRAISEFRAERKRREVEESLRREREFSAQLIESSVDGITAFDRASKITVWNSGMERITGLAREQVLGRSALVLFPFLKEIVEESHMREALAGRSAVAKEHPFSIPETGRKGFFDSYYSPLRDNSGRVVGGFAIVHDITERRKLEEQFRQAQKMEAVGRLAGGVAHDFNNLLTAIIGYGDLVQKQLRPGDPALLDLEEIQRAAERAAELTRQLLAFSRQQVLQPEVLDLNTVVADIEKLIRRLVGEDLELRTVCTGSPSQVRADRGQIGQVLMNLVVNARDAMPRGGRLTIETANVEIASSPSSSPGKLEPGSYVLLAVRDTGSGMDEATRARIFEPFFTTKESGKGTGLGLSTVYGIVEQSGGHIEVLSEVDQGTSFEIYLPRVEQETPQSEETRDSSPLPAGTETILVVEDDGPVRSTIVRALRQCGFSVMEAESGAEGLRICEREDVNLELLVTDVVMPQMSGPELVHLVLRRRPDLRVLFVSGFSDRGIVSQDLLRRAAFLQKPFRSDTLAWKVREVLDSPLSRAA